MRKRFFCARCFTSSPPLRVSTGKFAVVVSRCLSQLEPLLKEVWRLQPDGEPLGDLRLFGAVMVVLCFVPGSLLGFLFSTARCLAGKAHAGAVTTALKFAVERVYFADAGGGLFKRGELRQMLEDSFVLLCV